MKKETIKIKDLSKILKPYSNQWVALSENEEKVVSYGKTVKEVIKKAEEKGVKSPIVTKVPAEYGSYVL